MTAPTSDRAQQARKELGNALHEMLYKQTAPMNVAYAIDALITERLGGGERESVKDWAFCPECGCRESWTISRGGERECKRCKRTWFPDIDYSDAVSDNLTVANAHREFVLAVENVMEHELNIGVPTKEACVAAIRTLAQTAKDATARAEAAEAANMELDKERRSSDQSARDLRAENARLRAQLDAMTGEQVPFRWTVVGKDRMSFTFTNEETARTWASGEGGEVVPLYLHPSPAARVVGEMLVVQKGEMRTVSSTWNDEMLTTPPDVGTYALSITPNADGQTARVDEVSDTANGLRHVARGPNSPQGAVAYGRTAKGATQLLDTIRQHKSTPNADGAK